MSEAAGPFEPENNPAGNDAGRLTAGALLRQARQAAGLHIAALAVALKVPVRKLEALEADRFDLLPDAVFIRALASSVCRNLKVDAAPILDRLPQTGGMSRLAASSTGINVPFHGANDRSGPSLWSQMSRPAVLAGLVLLLAALVLIFMPVATRTGDQPPVDPVTGEQANTNDAGASTSGQAVELPRVDGAAVMATPATAEGTGTGASLAAAGAAAAEPAVMAALPASPARATATIAFSAAAATAASAPASQPAAVPAGAASAPAAASPAPVVPGNEVLVFKASGESWIEVTDARRVVVLRRLVTAGESVGAAGTLPLSAVVGRADVTQVQVRGKALDLSGVARDNVARFEVR